MTLKKIISGGQTGADVAALIFAKEHGLETGGWMPKGFRIENSYRPEYATAYGMKETISKAYQPRTELNVRSSDGTLIFGNELSSGSRLTISLCEQWDKPFIKIQWPYKEDGPLASIWAFIKWLEDYNIETLNVAGNRESVNPGIHQATIDFLRNTIGKL